MTKLTREDLLILLIEECSEVSKCATKCLRFGYDADSEFGRNDLKLAMECGEVRAVIRELRLDPKIMAAAMETKIARAIEAKEKYGVRKESTDATEAG